MNLKRLIGLIFGIVFIVILYSIIYYALKIMYKDVKGGNKSRKVKKAHGLEVLSANPNGQLKVGSILPVTGDILTLGRKQDNLIALDDHFVSSYHAKIYIRNNEFYLEDLASTNGTYVNENKISGRVRLKVDDVIRLGSTAFKVIG